MRKRIKREQEKQKKKEIQVQELVCFPPKAERPILDHVKLHFHPGRIYGIIGPNGSGKTTLLRQLLHFLVPESGHVFIGGRDVSSFGKRELSQEISLVPQSVIKDVEFPVYEVVMMGRNPYQTRFGPVSERDRELVGEAMKFTNTGHLKERVFSSLSGGEAQRVTVARAIAQDTEWMLLDEPVSSLDIFHQKELMDTLAELNKSRGTSVIAVLHDLNLASAYCTDMIMMQGGQVKYSGKTGQVMTKENLEALYGLPFVTMVHPVTGAAYYAPK